MFCPQCNSYLTEDDIIKKNAKYTPDGAVAVEYDARCPRCNVEMGKISWGQFTVNPGLAVSRDRISDLEQYEPLIPPPPPIERVRGRVGSRRKPEPQEPEPQVEPESEEPQAEAEVFEAPEYAELVDPYEPVPFDSLKYCPHCGLPLPEGY